MEGLDELELIASPGTKRVWLGRSKKPFEFVCPASGEYALLLVVEDADVSEREQQRLSECFVRTGCRYAVCFGPKSSSWDDSIDGVGVMDEVDGNPSPFVMTTWHDDEPIEETVEFFAHTTIFDDWVPEEFVVWILGGSDRRLAEVRDVLLQEFGDSSCDSEAYRK